MTPRALLPVLLLALLPATLSAQVCRGISAPGEDLVVATTISSTSFAYAAEQRVAVTAGRLVHLTGFLGQREDADFDARARVVGASFGVDVPLPVVRGLYLCPAIGGFHLDGPRGFGFSDIEMSYQEYEVAFGIAYERRVSDGVVVIGTLTFGSSRLDARAEDPFSDEQERRDYRERRVALSATLGERLLFRVGTNHLDARYRPFVPYAWPYGRRSNEIAWQVEVGYVLLR